MRPPICAICDEDFREVPENGDGIYFKLSDSDKQYNKKIEKSGIAAHPAGFEWFCVKHLKIAVKYKHLTVDEAIDKIEKEIN